MRMWTDSDMNTRIKSRITGIVVVMSAVFFLMPDLTFGEPVSTAPGEHPFAQYVSSHPTLFALRGGMTDWPQHTLEGYTLAILEAQAEVLDLDIRLSADGIPVVIFHDTVDETTNGTGVVSGLTLSELKALDAGYWFTPDNGQSFPYRGQGLTIPTLEEILIELDGNGEFEGATPYLNIELKVTGQTIENQLLTLLRRYDLLNRSCVGAIEGGTAARLKREEPNICTFHSQPSALCFTLDSQLAGSSGLCPEHDVLELPTKTLLGPLGDELIQQALQIGIPIVAVDPANETDIRSLLDLGVDGLICDNPTLARAIMESP